MVRDPVRNRDPISERLFEAVENGVDPQNAADVVLGFDTPEEHNE